MRAQDRDGREPVARGGKENDVHQGDQHQGAGQQGVASKAGKDQDGQGQQQGIAGPAEQAYHRKEHQRAIPGQVAR